MTAKHENCFKYLFCLFKNSAENKAQINTQLF